MNPTYERQPARTRRSTAGIALLLTLLLVAVAACGSKSPADQALDELNAGLAASAAGNADEALAHYKKCLTFETTNKYCSFNIGVHAQNAGAALEAENDYRLVLLIDPNYGPALYNLAILRSDARTKDEAIALYRHLLDVDPTNASGHFNLGLLLAATGDSAGAKSELDQAVKLDPSLVVPNPLPGPASSKAPAPASSEEPSPSPS